MQDVFNTVKDWAGGFSPFAIATVTKTWGSSPRPVGSAMVIAADGSIDGSVSGGCVEGAVVKAARDVITTGKGKRLNYGVTDDDAWAVGLSCGGKIAVYVEPFLAHHASDTEQNAWRVLQKSLEENEPCILVTPLVDGENAHAIVLPSGEVHGADFGQFLNDAALDAYNRRVHQVVIHDDTEYFIQVFPRKSQMLIIGAAHVTTHLVQLARMYHFESIVIDPRGAFSANTQFATPPDKLFEAYPSEVMDQYVLDKYTYAVILSHDPKIDDNALEILLPSNVAYIGALGSKKTHAKRVDRLLGQGFDTEALERIHAPIGVNINAMKPEEIALSIMGQVIQVKNEFARRR